MRKLPHNAISTDKAVRNKGIFLPSKCHCCLTAPSAEYNNPLFLTSDIAKEVWRCFNDVMNINGNCLTHNHTLTNWWQRIKGNSLSSWLSAILPGTHLLANLESEMQS